MQIQRTAHGDAHEVAVSGRIDSEGANQLDVACAASIAEGAKHLTVELSAATFLCSAGLRTLLQYWRQTRNKGGSFHVANPSPEASTLLNTSGFKDMLIQKCDEASQGDASA
jgi:anti-anti-sigma factor